MNLLRGLLRWSARLLFLASALLFAICSALSDYDYGLGMKTGSMKDFVLASTLFPLVRSYRSGPAYEAIQQSDINGIGLIMTALRYDPFAADLWYGLARMQLKSGNEAGYIAALTELQRLTPGLHYEAVKIRGTP